MKRIFIDGSAGTTGLRIHERLSDRSDVLLMTLPDEKRKDAKCRAEMLNQADIAFLCLPDAAAIEAVGLIENNKTVVIDTSTAHRTEDGWAYGFPELGTEFYNKIKTSDRIAVPGCHASGFIALVKPLVESGVLSPDSFICCNSLTGYSGGGKKMITEYESEDRGVLLNAPRQYALSQQHKHLKEMKAITGIEIFPAFCPIVADFYSGMEVTIPLFKQQIKKGTTIDKVIEIYKEKYCDSVVYYNGQADPDGLLSASALSGTDKMEISVFGNDERILLTARYDNLGKGASGAAVEVMNIVMGVDKTKGLVL